MVQAECLTKLEDSWLSEIEKDVVRWALNARWSKPARVAKAGLSLLVYKRASAVEVLVRLSSSVFCCMHKVGT
jgi:23S rRNA maturation mini-RNase III